MGAGFKIFKGHKLTAAGLTSYGFLNRQRFKKIRKKLGLTSENKLVRSLKRNLLGKAVGSAPTSASSYSYQHKPRTLSQLVGGV